MKFDYSHKDIVRALKAVGVVEGDALFCHSNIGFFGVLENAKTAQDYYQQFKKAIFEVLGESGTFVVPTFSYSFCWKKDFILEETPSVCGMLSEMLRKDHESFRSEDANFSVAALGAKAEELTKNSGEYFFGPDGFCARFMKVGGKFCNFNFDAGSTFIHFVERSLQVPYRTDKAFEGNFISNHKSEKRTFYHYVFDHNKKEDYPDFVKFDLEAKKRQLIKSAVLGKGSIVCLEAEKTYHLIEEMLQKDPMFLRLGFHAM